ncbi:imidazoleglycerol-phosphate dehydratase [Candidatus Caldarchaeum subterraneum]|uniref:Imidazoleglycerol-phosphate dehydratase n=1 Tax=Caldiarchaeum subterraneum TaxID=311458 RepID=E6N7A3_CALS0|nr:imidazole glycerol phosphate dehydratase [Candidatus Caldarchaeum subterraneum]BAJ48172.1 imidazoleglycerol-phosphate dehydratase [Candidatus Caldarchaeum subterraneum]BAJ50967.1 imidazoleglycerol-phosphate dehydratase [Candidatus Caldarchaeum subterraneum]
MTRTGKAFRETRETRISAEITLDGTGVCRASTGYRFLDHMITTLAKHSLIDITLHAEGDMRHHVVEDTAIVLGQAFDKALGDRVGIKRFGYAIVPMDEALALAAVDLVKRPKPVIKLKTVLDTVEDIPVSEITHFLESFTTSLNATIHIRVLSGMDDHHKVEAAFKALAQAIKQAIEHEPRTNEPPSTKGTM